MRAVVAFSWNPLCAGVRGAVQPGFLLPVAGSPSRLRLCGEVMKTPRADCRAHGRHQLLVIGEIDRGEHHGAEHLVRLDEVVQVGARIVARGRAWTLLIERTW